MRIIVALLLALANSVAQAGENYPSKPIRVIVPYAAGGADTYVRPLMPALQAKHNIVFVVDIVLGAGGLVGANQVKRSAADGYTLLFAGTGAITIAPKLQNAPLTPADFAPILSLVSIPYFVAVRSDSKILGDGGFINYIKRNPEKLTYGSPGSGSAPHLAMEVMVAGLGTKVTHVPYSGIAPAVQALLGGHVDAVIGAASVVLPQVNAGKLAAIGVTSRDRFPLAPTIPALNELGANVDVSTHFGFFAPAGTPRAVIDRLGAAIRDAATDPLFISAMNGMQNRIAILGPAEFAAGIAAEVDYFNPVVETILKK